MRARPRKKKKRSAGGARPHDAAPTVSRQPLKTEIVELPPYMPRTGTFGEGTILDRRWGLLI